MLIYDNIVFFRMQKHRSNEFDRVVIETTGLANPAPIIQTFFLEPSVADHMKLDGVVTIVDARHAELHLDEQKPEGIVNEAVEQVAFADRIVLNKTDLVSTADLDRLEERLQSINAMATIQRAQHAAVPLKYVLGIDGFDLQKVEDDIAALEAREAQHDDHHGHDHECSPGCTHHSHDYTHHHDHGHEHAHSHSHALDHTHDDSVTSVSITVDGDLDLDKVNLWLGGLLEVKSNDMYRMKGVLAIDGFDRRFVFQGVHMLFEGMPDRLWRDDEPRYSRMVFIGKDLDGALIREGFEECVVKEKRSG